jgi:hypothetical protein
VFVIVGVALAVTVGVLGVGVFVMIASRHRCGWGRIGASTSVFFIALLFVSFCSATTVRIDGGRVVSTVSGRDDVTGRDRRDRWPVPNERDPVSRPP